MPPMRPCLLARRRGFTPARPGSAARQGTRGERIENKRRANAWEVAVYVWRGGGGHCACGTCSTEEVSERSMPTLSTALDSKGAREQIDHWRGRHKVRATGRGGMGAEGTQAAAPQSHPPKPCCLPEAGDSRDSKPSRGSDAESLWLPARCHSWDTWWNSPLSSSSLQATDTEHSTNKKSEHARMTMQITASRGTREAAWRHDPGVGRRTLR